MAGHDMGGAMPGMMSAADLHDLEAAGGAAEIAEIAEMKGLLDGLQAGQPPGPPFAGGDAPEWVVKVYGRGGLGRAARAGSQ